MKVKLFMISQGGQETLIAKFNNAYEAAQCCDLLQACQMDQSRPVYIIEYYDKIKKINKRRGPDSFYKRIAFFEPTQRTQITNFLK